MDALKLPPPGCCAVCGLAAPPEPVMPVVPPVVPVPVVPVPIVLPELLLPDVEPEPIVPVELPVPLPIEPFPVEPVPIDDVPPAVPPVPAPLLEPVWAWALTSHGPWVAGGVIFLGLILGLILRHVASLLHLRTWIGWQTLGIRTSDLSGDLLSITIHTRSERLRRELANLPR